MLLLMDFSRAHFFAVSAQMMRRILVDFARDRHYLKRGGGALWVSLGEAASFTECRGADLVALDEALTALAEVDRRKGQVVEMRFFGGLSVKEVADVLKVSEETVLFIPCCSGNTLRPAIPSRE
jgi:RNA polymerase sigma-70 factor, ECF subfamily